MEIQQLKDSLEGAMKEIYTLQSRYRSLERLCLHYIKHLDPSWLEPDLMKKIYASPKRFLANELKGRKR